MHHSHSHNHGHGHSHEGQGHRHHAGCSHGHQENQIDPQEYFKQLNKLKYKNVQFYWNEVIKGTVLNKNLQYYGLGFLNSINSQVVQSIVGMAHMMATCDWMPLILRPFVSGLFWPLLLYVFINYKILTGMSSEEGQQSIDRSVYAEIFALPIIFYTLVGLRTSGRVATQANLKIAKKILEVRPYLQNMNLMCKACNIPKAFRAGHCPMCKICVPKFTRHSLVFGVCIGAANELLSSLFFLSMVIFSAYSLFRFTTLLPIFGIITIVLMYSINISILWMSTTEFCTFIILNFRFGLSQFEVQSWMGLQYLIKPPLREFVNSCNNGLFHNLSESAFAMLGVSGFQAELYDNSNQNQERQNQPLRQQISNVQNSSLGFPPVKEGIKYVVNWDKAFMVVVPQMPNHPNRKQIEKMMKIDEPKMIAKFKLMKKFVDEIKKENPQLNQFQVQQKAMMKMGEHMSKNPELANSMKPPPEQQKMIQLQMLGHMKMQFQSDPEIFKQFQDIESKLKSGSYSPDDAAVKMRALQQKIMQKKMKQIMEAQRKQQESQAQVQGSQKSAINLIEPERDNIQSKMIQKLEKRSRQMQLELQNDGKSKVQNNEISGGSGEKVDEEQKLKMEQLIEDENL